MSSANDPIEDCQWIPLYDWYQSYILFSKYSGVVTLTFTVTLLLFKARDQINGLARWLILYNLVSLYLDLIITLSFRHPDPTTWKPDVDAVREILYRVNENALLVLNVYGLNRLKRV